ncbi:glucoamylase family protein [Lewinella sp. W8]|uniref:glucoamylase family protein n=1 Tax=Lewinella sp. W8 TaxID=2528208 RepID=UPI0011A6CE92|nr:glucoamylase family protein [Lewinella sp. W8]
MDRYEKVFFPVFLLLFSAALWSQPAAVTGVSATAYDHHIEVFWNPSPNPSVNNVRIFGSHDGGPFELLGSVNNVTGNYVDFVGDFNVKGRYFIRAIGSGGQLGEPSDTVSATTFEMTDSMLLDMVQAYTFRYFYDFGHPTSGMARERNTTATVTTGGSGFGVMALIVGAERGFITYEQALDRTTKIVNFLGTVPRFRGAFSHWMNGTTGAVIPFSALDDGGDLVETAFLIQGLLTARVYYSGDSPEEIALRENITELWEGVDWSWYRRNNEDLLYWHWSPQHEFAISLPVRGFNETHIIYLLALGAPNPDYAIPPSLYHTGWAGGAYENSLSYYGIPLLLGRGKGGPLFFTHYSYLGFDPRGKRDQYANYFEVGRNHSLIDYEHCIDNPYNHEGYGPECWGLTASDDPDGYLAHAPDNRSTDNGTITPTAALSSMPYTPEESMAALKHFYREMGDQLWGPYGFYDAFNESRNWYARSYLAIDQGPIICMIENHRSGLLWDLFMQNPEVDVMLEAAGFVADTTPVSVPELPGFLAAAPRVFPNPASDVTTLELQLAQSATVSVELLSLDGRSVHQLQSATRFNPGLNQISLHLRSGAQRTNTGLPGGYYLLKINGPGGVTTLPILLDER